MARQSIFKSIGRGGALVALCVWVLPAVSVAQQYYDPGLLQKTINRKPVEYQPPGIRMGSFLLSPGAELTWEHKDNIFYRENSDISDNIIHVRPWLNLSSGWSRHQLNLNAYADIGIYSDSGTEDYEDWVVSLDGRIDIKRGSAFNYKASYMQLHEDRSSPDDVGGIKPTEFSFSGFDVGYSHTFNRLTAVLGYGRQDTDYDSNIDGDGSFLDNQDRDRSRDTVTLRLGYEYSEQSGVFFSYAANSLDYDQKIDDQGYQRSSDGIDLRAGLSWDMTGVLNGDLYLQYVDQDYDDPSFSSVDGFGIGAELGWTPTKLTDVRFKFANTPQETTQSGASGYFSTLYSVRVQHELRRNLLANFRFSYTDNKYENNGLGGDSLNDTHVYRSGVGLNYLVNRHINISGGYVHEKQDANSTTFEYSTNRWFITLGLEL